MATITTIQESIRICRDAGISLFIWGGHGLGKSSLVASTALNDSMGCINSRLSQMESSDIRGLPDRVDGRTVYLPPADMPRGGMSWDAFNSELAKIENDSERDAYRRLNQYKLDNGILFLDELNRSQDDVLQAAFELVLDRKVGQYVLPTGWSIVCAGNFMEGYMTNGFTDPAFIDRFCHIILSAGETTLEEWINYMVDVHGNEAAQVIEFTTTNLANLDAKVEGSELGFPIQPSRRSWDSVVRVLQVCKAGNYSETAKTAVVCGLVGQQLGVAFARYDCPVKPREVVSDGVKKLSSRLKELTRNQFMGLSWGLVSYLKPNINDEKGKEGDIALDFAEWSLKEGKEEDLIISFLRNLVVGTEKNDHVRAAALSNPRVAELLKKANKRKGGKGDFLSKINDRPELQKLISNVSWGI